MTTPPPGAPPSLRKPTPEELQQAVTEALHEVCCGRMSYDAGDAHRIMTGTNNDEVRTWRACVFSLLIFLT